MHQTRWMTGWHSTYHLFYPSAHETRIRAQLQSGRKNHIHGDRLTSLPALVFIPAFAKNILAPRVE